MSFEVIDTQEKFDLAVKDRLERQAKKYEGYMSPSDVQALKDGYEEKLKNIPSYEGYTSPDDLKTIKDEYDAKINTLTSENNSLKLSSLKQDVAYEYKIPRDMASRLKGDTEDDIRADADLMSKYIKQGTMVAPLADPNPSKGDLSKESKIALLSQLKD